MSKLVAMISKYISSIIIGFESGMYKMVEQNNKERMKLLADKNHPFITLFRDLHEKYYTATFNSIINRGDKNVVEMFDNLKKLTNHSNRCILNILANLSVSVHFNIDRKKLIFITYDEYISSVGNEVSIVLSAINLPKLFDHICVEDELLEPIAEGGKFIEINLSFKSNNTIKPINSFTDTSVSEEEIIPNRL